MAKRLNNRGFRYTGDRTDWIGFEFLREGNVWEVCWKEDDEEYASDWVCHPLSLEFDDILAVTFSVKELLDIRCLQLERRLNGSA